MPMSVDNNLKNEEENFLYGIAEKELDEPIPEIAKAQGKDTLELIKIKQKEKKAARKEKRYYRAFNLIIGCLVMLGIIYVVDTSINVILNKSASPLTEGLMEIIKTLLFTLSGYLFARESNKE